MSIKRRTYQGGSVVNFVVIGAVLAVLLAGSVYYLKQHGDQVRKDQAIAEAEKNKPAETKPENTDNTETNTESNEAANNEPSATATNTTPELPTTGPEMTFGNLVGAYLLTVSAVGFALSRRKLIRSL